MQVNDRARYAYQYFINKGISPQVAAGIVANLAIESGNFDDKVLSGSRRGDDGTAHYAQQLRFDRKDNFEAYALATGRKPSDLNAQLDFVLEETNPESPYADAQAAAKRDSIFNAPDHKSATHNFMRNYERASRDPKYNHINKRLDYADKLIKTDVASSDPTDTPAFARMRPTIDPGQPSLDEQQVAQMRSQPRSLYDDPSVSFTGLGLIRAGEILQHKRSPMSFQSAFTPPEGVQADAQIPFSSVRSDDLGTNRPTAAVDPLTEIASADSKAIPLGTDTALAASNKTQFGIRAAGDNVDINSMLPETSSALTMAANQFGQDLTINSGYRSQARQDAIRNSGNPNRVTVAKHSRHTEGDASDISIKGMSQEEVARLVDSLAGSGFTAFGYYPTHLHADMRSSVPSSFNPDTNWGGWTKLPPEVMAVLLKRGYKPGLSADQITRGF